jgi:hypothetical protein
MRIRAWHATLGAFLRPGHECPPSATTLRLIRSVLRDLESFTAAGIARAHLLQKTAAKQPPHHAVGRSRRAPLGIRAASCKGVQNKVTREVQALAQGILEDPVVQATLLNQAQRGKLAPAVMSLLFHYAYGKPKEAVALEGGLEVLTIRIVDEYADPDDARGSDPAPKRSGS